MGPADGHGVQSSDVGVQGVFLCCGSRPLADRREEKLPAFFLLSHFSRFPTTHNPPATVLRRNPKHLIFAKTAAGVLAGVDKASRPLTRPRKNETHCARHRRPGTWHTKSSRDAATRVARLDLDSTLLRHGRDAGGTTRFGTAGTRQRIPGPQPSRATATHS